MYRWLQGYLCARLPQVPNRAGAAGRYQEMRSPLRTLPRYGRFTSPRQALSRNPPRPFSLLLAISSLSLRAFRILPLIHIVAPQTSPMPISRLAAYQHSRQSDPSNDSILLPSSIQLRPHFLAFSLSASSRLGPRHPPSDVSNERVYLAMTLRLYESSP
ncbi:hypothetical protein GGS23DRAFT_80229 [Durotheca rogersii]|uniref:uncharacterized protein n=1 Tax=Durotheca rogersii TaxID=419775 RepID=UPI002220CE90|nr:uncharacterized protein GGS23DRAFT_80229 [Durotheca rogersii]KAI5862527.1 hypothetical protein GGS23DRAFT_80229 [Durotheca rogersii]